ncbi:MAG: thioredoxin-like domain-containing protein [bacterium]
MGLYFGAHWAPPCKKFLPSLIEFYNIHNKESKKIEIIYISMDS